MDFKLFEPFKNPLEAISCRRKSPRMQDHGLHPLPVMASAATPSFQPVLDASPRRAALFILRSKDGVAALAMTGGYRFVTGKKEPTAPIKCLLTAWQRMMTWFEAHYPDSLGRKIACLRR